MTTRQQCIKGNEPLDWPRLTIAVLLALMVFTCISPLLKCDYAVKIGIIALLVVVMYFFLGKVSFIPVDRTQRGGRDTSLDLIRAIAIFLVVSVHSFLATGYYEMQLGLNAHSVGLTGIRWFCGCCNALFLLLTGSLLSKRESLKKALASLMPLIVTYLTITVIRIVALDCMLWKTDLSLSNIVEYLVSIGFSWYVKMYIGIALITPFLNIAWNRLNLHGKQLSLVVLAFLCCAAGVSKQIIPSYWMELWPFLYYFCGAFMAEYRTTIKSWLIGLLLIGTVGLVTFYSVSNTSDGVFSWTLFGGGGNGEHQALPLVVSSVLLFGLLRRVEIRNNALAKILKSISENAFCIYLFSVEITDNLVYPFLRNHVIQSGFINTQVLPVICSFCFAWALSALVNIPLKRFTKYFKASMNRKAETPYLLN